MSEICRIVAAGARLSTSVHRAVSSPIFLLLILLTLSALQVCQAAEKSPKFVSVPVYYLTDRAKRGEGFGSRRRYKQHCQHEMYYGTASIEIPNSLHKEPIESEFGLLGWTGTNLKPAKISPKEMIPSKDGAAAKTEFFERLAKALDQSKQSSLCVFVHGACDAFEDCAQDAATMAYNLQQPVVLYSWPSNPKWRSYFIDGSNNEWSQGHFNTFCKDLLEFQTKHPLKVVFVSHSMGNRLVIRSLPVSYGKGLVSAWELISADIDADTCRHYIMGYKEDDSKLRLYVSNRDKMLPLSQILSGGYYRTGEAANQPRLPEGWAPADKNFVERIDFTAMDKGFDGHSIPFSLVSSIVNKDDAPEGYEIVPETEVRANRLIRFANRSEKLDDTTGGLPPNYCKRVLKIKKNKKQP